MASRMTAVMTIISMSVGEIDQVERQEVAQPLGVVADARHQVAGALAAEELQRQPLQVGVGPAAQVGADALADPGQHIQAAPVEHPGQAGPPPPGPARYQATRPKSTGLPFWWGMSTWSSSGMVR